MAFKVPPPLMKPAVPVVPAIDVPKLPIVTGSSLVVAKEQKWSWKTPSSAETGQIKVLSGDNVVVPDLPMSHHVVIDNPALAKSDEWAKTASLANYKGYTDFLSRIATWLPQSVYF
jgi:hypothetical protein